MMMLNDSDYDSDMSLDGDGFKPWREEPATPPALKAYMKRAAPAPPTKSMVTAKAKMPKPSPKPSPPPTAAAPKLAGMVAKRPAPAKPKPRVHVEPDLTSESEAEVTDDEEYVHKAVRKPMPMPMPPKLSMSKAEGKKPMVPRPTSPVDKTALHLERGSRAIELNAVVKHLREKMDGMREFVFAREAEDNKSYDERVVPSWRDYSGNESVTKLMDLAHLLSSDRDFISYDTYCDITHHESLMSVLGGKNAYTPMVRKSDKETKTFTYIYDHLEDLLAPLVFSTSLFRARPEQLLAVAEKMAKYDVDLTCKVRRVNEQEQEAAEYMRTADCLPLIDLINYATGNGKTWATVLASMTEVSHPQLWQRMRDGWRDVFKANTVVANLGLSRCENLDGQELTRVVVALIPQQLMPQWEKTANAVTLAMESQMGIGFHVWVGLNKLQRASKADPLGKERTLKEAHELCTGTNKAMLWLVPAKTESAKKTVRAAPHLHIPIRIYDEMSARTEPKSKLPESRVMKNVIVQATVQRLETGTRAQSEHPLRKALGGLDFEAGKTSHAAVFHLLTAPDWLRLMVSKGMGATMPSGIRKVCLKVRLQSLAARVNHTDMNITSLDELLHAMLNNANTQHVLSDVQRREFLERCRRILGASAPPEGEAGDQGEQGNSIHARLQAALGELKSLLDAIPPAPQPPAPGVPIPQAEIAAYQDFEREKHTLNTMIRMLTNLSDAVCVDPPPECPITMDDIPPEHVGIFPCCTNLFDARYKDQIPSNTCPMCRAPLRGVIAASQAIDALVDKPKPKPLPKPAAAGSPSGGAAANPSLIDDEPRLLERFKTMERKTKFTASSKAVAKVVREYLRFKPRGARILLAFACRAVDGDENEATRKTRDLLMADVSELTSVMAVHRRRPEIVEDFTTDDDSNRVLVINTNDRSASLEGLDLWNTNMVIIDRLDMGHRYGGLDAAKIVQTIGRAMRPQVNKPNKSAASGSAGFPAKMIVLLDRDETNRAAAEENGDDEHDTDDDE